MKFRLERSFGKGSVHNIEEFESKFTIVLPVDYRNFILDHNGGVPSPKGCVIKGPNEVVPVEILFGFLGNELRHRDLVYMTETRLDDFPKGVVPIGRDCFGNLFVLGGFNASVDRQGIFYYDGRPIFSETDDNGNTYPIANSFTEFMENLVDFDPQNDGLSTG